MGNTVDSEKLSDAINKALARGVKAEDIVEISTVAKGGDPDRAEAIRDGKDPDDTEVNDDGASMGKAAKRK